MYFLVTRAHLAHLLRTHSGLHGLTLIHLHLGSHLLLLLLGPHLTGLAGSHRLTRLHLARSDLLHLVGLSRPHHLTSRLLLNLARHARSDRLTRLSRHHSLLLLGHGHIGLLIGVHAGSHHLLARRNTWPHHLWISLHRHLLRLTCLRGSTLLLLARLLLLN